MKKIILLLLIFVSVITKAQDQLFKKDNSKLEVKILEITPTQVKYKLFSNPDGPLYVINKNEVALIIYKNGQHEAFKDAPKENTNTAEVQPDNTQLKNELEEKEFLALTKNNNVAFFNACELANFALGGSYFRELLNNHIDVQLPFAFSFGEPFAYNAAHTAFEYSYQSNNVYNFNVVKKTFDLGIGVYINTTPTKAITHFIGPMFRIAQYNATYRTNWYQEPANIDPNQSYSYTSTYFINRSCVFNETYFTLNNGFLFRIRPKFNVMFNINIGRRGSRNYIANNPSQYSSNNYTIFNGKTVVQIGINFGYRF